ncbi:MAG: RIP metalloprotease RseP [Calditrichaeota bacterium]|nr:RIP metalloprotease RseP [Calditrichota bacterium]MCB0269008.1 RIP metalloprotease RseP [Calditrichota bacterium]
MIYIISMIVVLSILVFVHELGHFLAAKMFGVRVERFSIGFPPRLFGVQYGETDYCISATPLGGYVKLSGMVDESMDAEQLNKAPEPYEFRAKPVYQQVVIITAGVIMNFILAVGILGGMVFMNGEPYNPSTTIGYVAEGGIADSIGVQVYDKILTINGQTPENWQQVERLFFENIGKNTTFTIERNGEQKEFVLNWDNMTMNDFERFGIFEYLPAMVGDVSEGYPAAEAGLQKGDRIIAVNDSVIQSWIEMTGIVVKHPDQPLNFTYLRNGDTLQTSITPTGVAAKMQDGTETNVGRIGITRFTETREVGFAAAMVRGFNQCISIGQLNLRGFGRILSGKDSAKESLAGPLAIAQMAGDIADRNIWDLLPFMAYLSVVLAFINILPIPALDGGHLIIILIEGIRRKPLPLKAKIMVQQVGMAILLTFIVFVFYNDIARWIAS